MAFVLNLVRQKMFDAASHIQFVYRTYIANKHDSQEKLRDCAATKIQSIYRMHVERRQIKKDNMKYAEAAALVILMDSSAIKIQSVIRGFLERERWEEFQGGVEIIQATWRMYEVQKEVWGKHHEDGRCRSRYNRLLTLLRAKEEKLYRMYKRAITPNTRNLARISSYEIFARQDVWESDSNLKNIKEHSKSTKPIRKLRREVLRLRLMCEGINLYLNYSHLKIVDDDYMMNINMRDTLQWYIRTKWIRIAGYLNLDNTYVKPGTSKTIFKQRSWSQIINACGGPEPHKIGAYFTQEEAKLFLKYCQQDFRFYHKLFDDKNKPKR